MANNGIWIRSQDRESLDYCSNFAIGPVDKKMVASQGEYNMAGWVNDESGRWGIIANGRHSYFSGIYSTKEKAMAVLNNIQRHVFLEDIMFIMPEDTSPNFKCEGGEICYVD